MSKVSPQHPGPPKLKAVAEDALTLFAALWAVASLFHVLANASAAQLVSNPTTLGFSHLLLAIGAIWLLITPARNIPLITVAILGLITTWLEAPALGNHWLVAAFVDLALLLSVLTTLRHGRIDRTRFSEVFLPLGRWCLVLFYSFAAFAKLNSAFLDTAVSCSTYYFDETVRSLGLGTPLAVGVGGAASLLPYAAAVIELSIPLLLLSRCTRAVGVTLGLLFHSLIALDRAHLFVDFSSVLVALFILFLPNRFAVGILGFLKGKRARGVIVWAAFAGLIMLVPWVGFNNVTRFIFLEGRLLLWYIFDATVLLGVGTWLIRHRGQTLERPFAVRSKGPIWLVVIPALVVVNGLLPYVELRTAYAFTMYSNLRMVDGKSNHLIVRATLPIANRQADLVKIVDSSDPGLVLYSTYNYLLPWDSFRAYLAEHPDTAVIYERGGKGYVVERVADYPELVTAPPLLTRKLLALRAVDGYDPPRCQDVFLPAL